MSRTVLRWLLIAATAIAVCGGAAYPETWFGILCGWLALPLTFLVFIWLLFFFHWKT